MAVIDFSSYRKKDIKDNLNRMGIHPLDVMVTGVTGAGKSTTLNAFFHKTVAREGCGVDPETMDVNAYELNEWFRIWDTPGLGDGVGADEKHKRKMIELLQDTYDYNDKDYGFIDMCIVIIEGANRDMGTTYRLLNKVVVPNIQNDRIFVAVNQADVAMKGHHWDRNNNIPDGELLKFLDEQANSIKRRVKEDTGINIITPVCYSAKYGWNVQALFDMIIDHMPVKKRELKWR
jgi:hypothetical protein